MNATVEELCAIRPDEIEIVKRPDTGEDWLLGAGGFGSVCLLVMHSSACSRG